MKWSTENFLPIVCGQPQYVAPVAINIGSVTSFLECMLPPHPARCFNHFLSPSLTSHKFPLIGVLGSVSSLFSYPYYTCRKTLPWCMYPSLSVAEGREVHARVVLSPGSPGSSTSSLTIFRLSTYQISQKEVVRRVSPFLFPSKPVPTRISLPFLSTYLMSCASCSNWP